MSCQSFVAKYAMALKQSSVSNSLCKFYRSYSVHSTEATRYLAEGDANSPLVTSTVSSFVTKVMADILWTKDIQIFIIIKLHEDLAKETAEISHLAALRNTSDL